jgi:NADH-quinone oxidoreductase subunit C
MAEASTEPAQTAPANPTVALARRILGDDVLEVVDYRGETTVVVPPARIVALCQALRDDPALRYDFMADITAVDWLDREPRFDVVYHLLSLPSRAVVRLKVRVGAEGEETPHVPSVTGVWVAANWFEREVFDLFGIIFDGHPDLRRIMMPDDWTTHPLRKDYPLAGFVLPDPHWGGQVPFGEALPPGTGQQTLRTPGGVPGDIDPTQ